MLRCLELAAKGMGDVAPNPLVGAVLVYHDKIIGEGYHEQYGQAHAEVNAINSVSGKELISQSALYVNLEPCAHHGKTPPCVDLVLEKNIPRVVIANQDPFHQVSGRSIKRMKDAGIEVVENVLKEKGAWLNRRFFTYHQKKRPYIILKWAQSRDGFFAKDSLQQTWISNKLSKKVVHRWRSEEAAIMVGTQTAITDNPQLTNRYWGGKQPVRILLDRQLKVSPSNHLLDDSTPTLVLNESKSEKTGHTEYIKVNFDNTLLSQLMDELYQRELQSLIVEGGAGLLSSFVEAGLWDEARIITGDVFFGSGIKAPVLQGDIYSEDHLGSDQLLVVKNSSYGL